MNIMRGFRYLFRELHKNAHEVDNITCWKLEVIENILPTINREIYH
jgi:hypothetical protein